LFKKEDEKLQRNPPRLDFPHTAHKKRDENDVNDVVYKNI
jgi:hypothetical protein